MARFKGNGVSILGAAIQGNVGQIMSCSFVMVSVSEKYVMTSENLRVIGSLCLPSNI
jgi:hypothetical protein